MYDKMYIKICSITFSGIESTHIIYIYYSNLKGKYIYRITYYIIKEFLRTTQQYKIILYCILQYIENLISIPTFYIAEADRICI